MSSRFGARMLGNRRRSADDLARLVDGQRGLRDVGDTVRVGQLERLGVRDRLDEHGRLRRLAHRPDDLLVAGVADQQDRVALRCIAPGLDVHLRHQGTRRVRRHELEVTRVRVHGRRDAVRRQHDPGAAGHLGLALDEDRAPSSSSRTTWMLWTICLRT